VVGSPFPRRARINARLDPLPLGTWAGMLKNAVRGAMAGLAGTGAGMVTVALLPGDS
jgi:hypothetical protein